MSKTLRLRARLVSAFRAVPLQLCLALCLSLALLAPRSAAAGDEASVDTTLDLFVAVGQAAGLPINKEEVAITKTVVGCAINNSSLPDCVKNAVINTALSEAGAGDLAGAVTCLTAPGANVAGCITSGAIKVAGLPTELQPFVTCVAGSNPIDKCGEKFAVSLAIGNVPPDVQPTAACMIETGDALTCSTKYIADKAGGGEAGAIITCLGSSKNPGDAAACTAKYAEHALDGVKIPAEAQPIVDCVTSAKGDPKTCMANFAADMAAKNTPGDAADKATVHDIVQCSALGGALDACSKQAGGKLAFAELGADAQTAIQSALVTMKKLKPEDPLTPDINPPKTPAVLQNIIKTAEGFRDKNIGLIIQGLGPELAKTACDIILEAVLSPALAPIIAPVVDAFIQNRVDAFFDVMTAVHDGDYVKAGEVVANFYFNTFIEAPCSLLPDGGFREATCGNLAKGIAKVVVLGGDLVKDAVGLGEDVLDVLGLKDFVVGVVGDVLGPVGDVVKTVLCVFGDCDKKPPKPPACKLPPGTTAAGYYASHYLACLPQSAKAAANKTFVTGTLNATCTADFNNCLGDAAAVSKLCGAMGKKLDDLGYAIAGSNGTGGLYGAPAAAYAQTASGFVYERESSGDDDVCDANFWATGLKGVFVQQCTRKLERSQPLINADNPAICETGTYSSTGGAAYKACDAALNALDLGALAGPNSAVCKKKQLVDLLKPPCSIVTKPFELGPLGDATGRVILQPTEVGPCDSWRRRRFADDPKFIPLGGMGPASQPFHPLILPPGTGTRFPLPLPASFGQPGNGGATGNDGTGVVTHRPNPNQPGFNGWGGGGGGGGGGTVAHVDPNGRPHTILQPPKGSNGNGGGGGIGGGRRPLGIPKDPGLGPVVMQPPRQGLPSGGRPNPMDIIGAKNTDEAMHGAAGSGSGGAGDTRPLPGGHGSSVTPPPWGGVRPGPLGGPKQQAKGPPPGGPTGGGTNGTNPNAGKPGGGGSSASSGSGNTGGTNGTYSQSGNSPTTKGGGGTVTPRTAKPPPDLSVDYGGCGGCGHARPDDLHVR